MARKISIVTDARPAAQQPEVFDEVQPCPEFLPFSEDEIDYDAIEAREAEIDELVKDFICGLVGADAPEERDAINYGLQEELESLKDEFEEILAVHGITIHRPTIVMGPNGNEIVVNSLYEISE